MSGPGVEAGIKSNGAKDVVLYNAAFIDQAPLDATSGGVVMVDGPEGRDFYSLARADMVPDNGFGNVVTFEPDGGVRIPGHRIGKIVLKNGVVQEPVSLGAEQEGMRIKDENSPNRGKYAPQPEAVQVTQKELFDAMVESSTKIKRDDGKIDAARSQEEFDKAYWDMVDNMVEEAEAKAKGGGEGELFAAVAVFAQQNVKNLDVNSHLHVQLTRWLMMQRNGGFDPADWFLVAGAQNHTNISDLIAAMKAQEAMEYLAPVLYAPSLSSPFPPGGEAGRATGAGALTYPFTADQLAHMRKVGITPEELAREHLGKRLIYRMIGSPSAGPWRRSAYESEDEYLWDAHRALARGDIPTIDRLFGWHSTRIRTVLDGSGSSTVEASFMDTMLANPDTAVTLMLFTSALFRRFERMAMNNQDPRDYVANMLGMDEAPGERGQILAARLRKAAAMMLAVARDGNDAKLYKGLTPLEILQRHLLGEADQAPKDTRPSKERRKRLKQMFAGRVATRAYIQEWADKHNNGVPSTEAYFEPDSLGAPAYYMVEERDYWERAGMPRDAAIREAEISAARGLHRVVTARRPWKPIRQKTGAGR